MKIAFFDLNIVGIGRYPLQIANEIASTDKSAQFYFLYEEDPDRKKDEIEKKLPNNSTLIKITKADYTYIYDLLKNISPDKLLVMAQRIPDNAIISIGNKLNIDTFKFQHGLYIPFMKRHPSMFFLKFYKALRYMQYTMVIAEATGYPKYPMVKEYMKIFLRGKKITESDFPLEKINAKTVFVYGEYWKEYHQKEYGYATEQQIIVGYPDLMMLNEIEKKPQEDSICYICQTLVEDGRLPRKQMEEFIQILADTIKEKKLYVKLHPRSDMSLYKPLQNKKNVIFLKTGFPHCTKYIGHYSSMLAIAMYLTDEVFLWKFKKHNEYPFFLIKNAKESSNDVDKLLSFLENRNCFNEKANNNIEHYFFIDGNPINQIANLLT